MDSDRDGLLNFKEVAQTFSALCKGDHVVKLRIFYCLHLPGVVLPGELEDRRKEFGDDVDGKVIAEEGCDAEEFFQVSSKKLSEMADTITESEDPTEDDVSVGNANNDSASLRSLQRRLFAVSQPLTSPGEASALEENKTKTTTGSKLPPLPRDYFVHLWKSLHDLIEFGNLEDTTLEGREQMYHSISVVGTLLLQIGEVGQRVKDTQKMLRSRSIEEAEPEMAEDVLMAAGVPPTSFSCYDLAAAIAGPGEPGRSEISKKVDNPDWSVTFEQFLASVLNESCLVEFFDKKVDVATKLRQYGDSKMERQISVNLTGSKSVFYA